eukprot:6675129-Alexandrium_andersonii.AAC.1
MSASLVGSEMCIRDRCAEHYAWGGQGGCASEKTTRGQRVLSGWVPKRFAVSYTHLTLPTICSV